MLAGVRPLPFSWDRRPHTVHRNGGGLVGKAAGRSNGVKGAWKRIPPGHAICGVRSKRRPSLQPALSPGVEYFCISKGQKFLSPKINQFCSSLTYMSIL